MTEGVFAGTLPAHELGHFFGLKHTFAATSLLDEVNPATGAKFTGADIWDQVYCESDQTSAGFHFFSSQASFESEKTQYCKIKGVLTKLRLLTCDISDCNTASTCKANCNCDCQVVDHGSINKVPFVKLRRWTPQATYTTYHASDANLPAGFGIFTDHGGTHDPAKHQYRYGPNVMDYFSRYGLEDWDLLAPTELSDSQLGVVDAFSNHDVEFYSSVVDTIRRSDDTLPTAGNGTSDALTSSRSSLGMETRSFVAWGNGDQSFVAADLNIPDSVIPVAADLDGNGADELILYSPVHGQGVVHRFAADHSSEMTVVNYGLNFTLFAGNFDGQKGDDLYFYRAGASTGDFILWSEGTNPPTKQLSEVAGSYEPIVLDHDGMKGDDIVWYAASAGTANLWWSNGDRTFTKGSTNLGFPGASALAGNFDGLEGDDLLLYDPAASTAKEARVAWSDGQATLPSLKFVPTRAVLGSAFTGIAIDLDKSGADDIIWDSNGAMDVVWLATKAVPFRGREWKAGVFTAPTDAEVRRMRAVVGDFDGDGHKDIAWAP